MAETTIDSPEKAAPPTLHTWGGRIFIVLFGIWIINVVWAGQGTPWFMAGSGLLADQWPWVWASLIQVLLTVVPLLPFAWKWPLFRYRAVFQTWALAGLYPLFLMPTRLFIPAHSQLVLISQLFLTAVFLFVMRRLTKRVDAEANRATPAALLLGAATAVFISYPWLAWGAIGSPLDSLLSLGLGALVGWLASTTLGRIWLYSLNFDSRGAGWDTLTGGWVVGTAVLLLASALSFNGAQLLFMIGLPAAGWAMMGVTLCGRQRKAEQNSHALGLLAGLLTAFIYLFTDTDGLFLGALDGILRWSFQAAAVSMLLALAAGLILLLGRQRLPALAGPNRWLSTLTIAAGLIGLALFLIAGEPTFAGDRLFVIMADQADISAATNMTDYDARRQYVYQTLSSHAAADQADIRQTLDRLQVNYTPYYLVNALEIEGGFFHQLWLSTRSDVARVIPSPVLRPVASTLAPPAVPATAPTTTLWNLTNIGADRVWQELGVTGSGIIIGQSDSGVQWDHPELQDSYLGGADNHDLTWLDPWRDTSAPHDFSGHGTHTLGTILGNTTGVAPDAQWFGCANLYRNLGNPALYLDCLQFMLAPYPQTGDPFVDGRPRQSAHVLNNSWGCPEMYEGCDAESLLSAVQALRAAGIFVVASAGNDGPDCHTITDPIALYDDVFTVGAVDRNNNLAVFSSTGPVLSDGSGRIKPDITAPGVAILSALPGNSYGEHMGTSMAGPHVAGVVALIWSANPALIGDIAQTEQILRDSAAPYQINVEAEAFTESDFLTPLLDQTANPYADSCLAETDINVVPNNVAGYGIVNAYEAVKLALVAR